MLALIFDYLIAWYFASSKRRWFIWMPTVLILAIFNAVVMGLMSQYLSATIAGVSIESVRAADAVIAGAVIHPIIAMTITIYRRARFRLESRSAADPD